MKHYTLFFDGSCAPVNPGGTAMYGYKLTCTDGTLLAGSGTVGTGPGMSNNLAEFHGVAVGMSVLLPLLGDESASLQVYGDSNIVINIMNKKWKASPDKLYYPGALLAFGALNALRRKWVRVSFDWVPREMNTECDMLSRADKPS